jgi:transposase
LDVSAQRRYPTDLTDRQWELIEPLLPEPGTGGRPVEHAKREVVNAILYHVRAGGSWRMLPKDFPPWQTVYGYFRDWRRDGTLDRVHDALRERVRVTEESAQPGAVGGDRGLAVGQRRRHRFRGHARV